MTADKHEPLCTVCGRPIPVSIDHSSSITGASPLLCPTCQTVASYIRDYPEATQNIWQAVHPHALFPDTPPKISETEIELPEVLDGKRYRTIDRDRNKWYLSVSEVNGKPVEIFASTAFDRDHELQSRISNLTTITRLISLILRHIFMGEPLTFAKCLRQIQRSSRQKNDLPDMLYGVLSRYQAPGK